MIDNTVSVIEGVKNKVIDPKTFDANINPLGKFDQLKEIASSGAEDLGSLYETVIVESPLSGYFLKFIDKHGKNSGNFTDLSAGFFKELKNENLRAGLKRLWIEDFLEYCTTLNGISADNMVDIMMTEADYMSILAVYNTMSWEKQEREKIRSLIIPSCGYLYMDHYNELIHCDSVDTLNNKICKHYEAYKRLLESVPDPTKLQEIRPDSVTIEDVIFEQKTKKSILVFDEQANFGAFYAFMQLKEQEIKNIGWYCQLVGVTDPSDPLWGRIKVPVDSGE